MSTPPTIRCTVTARVGTDRAALVVRLPDGAGPAWAPGTQVLLTLLLLAADQPPPSSRVDPSTLVGGGDPSGALVELPAGAVEAMRRFIAEQNGYDDPDMQGAAEDAVGVVYPLIAARVRAEAVADERQRAVEEIRAAKGEQVRSFGSDPDAYFAGRVDGLEDAARIVAAAGSVPVATPQPVGMNAPKGEPLTAIPLPAPSEPIQLAVCDHPWATGPHTYTNAAQWPNPVGHCPGPVATPTGPVTIWNQHTGEYRRSWGDLAADVMGLVDRTLDGEPAVTHLAVVQASLPPGLTEVAGGTETHCRAALEHWVAERGLRDGERALLLAVAAETIAEPGVGVYTAPADRP